MNNANGLRTEKFQTIFSYPAQNLFKCYRSHCIDLVVASAKEGVAKPDLKIFELAGLDM